MQTHKKLRTKMALVGREMGNIKSNMTLLNPYLHSHLNPPHPTSLLRILDRLKNSREFRTEFRTEPKGLLELNDTEKLS